MRKFEKSEKLRKGEKGMRGIHKNIILAFQPSGNSI